MPRILLVEEDAALREVLSAMLNLRGLDTTAVAGAGDAMELLRQGGFQLVVCNLGLANDGIPFVLQAKTRWPRLPLIVITEDAQNARTLPVDAVLERPFLPSILIESIEHFFGGKP